MFGDGNFSNLPLGTFRVYTRVSDNAKYAIQPADMTNVQTIIPYIDKNGAQQNLTVSMSLKASVYNSAATESNDSIKEKAAQVYYSQNRMITAEDYQIVPKLQNPSIAKLKAQARAGSGISRFLDIQDPTGVYSATDIVSDEGMLYVDTTSESFDL